MYIPVCPHFQRVTLPQQFESLDKLVNYYEKKPLYRKMKLRYSVDDALLAKLVCCRVFPTVYHGVTCWYSMSQSFKRLILRHELLYIS